jgi:hypothetical protein
MSNAVLVSHVENIDSLKTYLKELCRDGRYSEAGLAIGMRSVLMEPQRMLRVQAELYRYVLNLLKDRLGRMKRKSYAAWYADFPGRMDRLVSSNRIVTDQAAAELIASHRSAFGPFNSPDDFFFWALDDRRLTLDEIVRYIEKTASGDES